MHTDRQQLGKNGMVWFTGVVEDRQDPLKIGRVRVRAHFFHTEDKTKIPTEALPWALVGQPTTNPANSGVSESSFLMEGTEVYGFFLDGFEAQKPLVIGSIAGIPATEPNANIGFNDPRSSASGYPARVKSISDPDDGTGVVVTNAAPDLYPSRTGEPDTSRYERNEGVANPKTTLQVKGIQTASHTATGIGSDSSVSGGTFDEPTNTYAAKYPFNHVRETESGHLFEFDDTPGAERINLQHRTGSYVEMLPDGTIVERSNKDVYRIVRGASYEAVAGTKVVSVDKGMRLLVNRKGKSGEHLTIEVGAGGSFNVTIQKGDVNLTVVNGNLNTHVAGDVNEQIDGNINRIVRGSVTETIMGDENKTVQGDFNESVQGSMVSEVDGSRTDSASSTYTILGSPVTINP